jgi:hypothetical protein
MPGMIAVVDRIAADNRFRSDFAVIFDIRQCEYTAELADGDMFVQALHRRQESFQNRFALVVPDSLLVLASLFCLLAQVGGVDRIKSFTRIEDAGDWCAAGK